MESSFDTQTVRHYTKRTEMQPEAPTPLGKIAMLICGASLSTLLHACMVLDVEVSLACWHAECIHMHVIQAKQEQFCNCIKFPQHGSSLRDNC